MQTVNVAISVPVDQRTEIEQLKDRVQSFDNSFESRALDGETVVTILLAINSTILPTLEMWLNARVVAKKETSVRYNGLRIDGYSAKDVSKIIDILKTSIEEKGTSD